MQERDAYVEAGNRALLLLNRTPTWSLSMEDPWVPLKLSVKRFSRAIRRLSLKPSRVHSQRRIQLRRGKLNPSPRNSAFKSLLILKKPTIRISIAQLPFRKQNKSSPQKYHPSSTPMILRWSSAHFAAVSSRNWLQSVISQSAKHRRAGLNRLPRRMRF